MLVTLAFLVFFGYDLSLNVVAAILTITGYSVNDTIVIFDRVRENLRSRRREPLDKIVNESVNQTLVAHDHHGRRDVPVRAVAVPVRRRGAAGFRVHDARRHHQRHVFDRVHRLGDRDHPERQAAKAAAVVRRRGGRPGRPQAEAGQGVVEAAGPKGPAPLLRSV